ncbi:MAG TPA: TOBE domain-containing protein, partial [Methylomirabilota bacterium]|nr:TOBE domain-containing protein [Methylomirabilota bacterium]
AEFIGKTNVVEGVAVSADTIARDGVRLRIAGGGLATGTRVAVSIRPHLIALGAPDAAAAGADGGNLLRGTVKRAAFLGDGVDYEVEVTGTDLTLRVAAPVSPRLRPGEAVGLRIDPAACVRLAEA